MRSVSIVLMLVLVAMASSVSADGEKQHYDISNAKAYFEDFITKFNRVYKDDEDREVHFRAFVESLIKINKLNEQNNSTTYGINKFADYTEEERKTMFGLKRP